MVNMRGVIASMCIDNDDGCSIGTMHIRMGAIQCHRVLLAEHSNMPLREHCALNGSSYTLDPGLRQDRRLQGIHRRR